MPYSPMDIALLVERFELAAPPHYNRFTSTWSVTPKSTKDLPALLSALETRFPGQCIEERDNRGRACVEIDVYGD